MKVAHLFNEINFSGAEIMYAQAAPLFQMQGYKLIAISTGKNRGNYVTQYEAANYTICHQPLPSGRFNLIAQFKYYVDFYRYLKREKIAIVHIHKSNLVISGVIAWLAKAKCIKTQHNTFKNRWFTLPYAIFWRFMLRKCFKVHFHTIGESVYLNELNYYKNPSIKINNWFDKERFYPAKEYTEKQVLRKQLNIAGDKFVIVSTGSCSHVKNHHDIIKALALVKNEVNCLYLHLGQGGTEQEEIQLATELGVANSIRFLGNQDQVRDYLVAADLYLMPSKFEGLSIASIEAMACELPCVLYDAPGLRDLIKHDDNGLLIAPDVQKMADCIISIYQDKAPALARAKHALETVNKEYSMAVSVQKMIDVYKS